MRIGIAGAQSVGKTTLLNALRSEPFFTNYTICNEVTRRVKSYGLSINEDGSNLTQQLIMQEHVYNVFMYGNMLTDRTALDGLVYTTYLYQCGKVDNNTLKTVRKIYSKVMPMYDHIFYIAPEFNVEADGVRSTDLAFRDNIVEIFEDIIKKEFIGVTRIQGTVRERVNSVIKILEGNNG